MSSVTNMREMFSGAYAFNQPIGGWDVSSVTDTNALFNLAQAFNQPIWGWDVSSVTDMGYMFRRSAFNQPIGGWDVSKVTNMQYMFNYAESFNQPIGGWDVSKVTKMQSMFYGARAFAQQIGGWDHSSMTTVSRSDSMFYHADAWQAVFVRSSASSYHHGPPSYWSLKPGLCDENHYVESGACVACAEGYVNGPGDDPQDGVDTTCVECAENYYCLLYTSPSPRDLSTSRMPSSA